MKRLLTIIIILLSALLKLQGQSLAVDPATVILSALANATGTFNITSNTSWTISSNRGWLRVAPSIGSNDGTIIVTASSANTSTDPRTATVTITGTGVSNQTVTVTQAGIVTLSVAPSTVSLQAASGSNSTFNITSNTSWTISDDGSWLDVSPVSGSGNAPVTVTANSANTSPTPRSASVTVSATGASDQIVTVTQAGTVSLSVAPSTVSLAAASGSNGTFNITSNTSWTISDNGSWLDVSPVSGSGNAPVAVSANSANTSPSPRSATVTVSASGASDQTVMVTQTGIPTYTINVSSSPLPGGTVTGGGTFSSGTSVTVTATPTTGYSFINWTEGGTQVATNPTYSFTLNSNRTLVANFSLNSFTVTTSSSPAGGGTTSGGGTFSYGTAMTVIATPNSNYTFVNWTEGGTPVSLNTSYSFTLNATRNLVANFSLNTYTISTSSSPSGGGTTSGGGTFNSGSSVTVNAAPNTGYLFVNWTEGGNTVSTNSSYTFTILSNRSLVANFSLLTYAISTSSSPVAGGTTTGGGTYNYGTSVTVTATPATGYQFVNWTAGGSQVSTSASYTFTVSSNRSFVANFSQLSYAINTTPSPAAGGTTSGSGTYNYGAAATVTATPSTGYQFVNWTEGGSVVSTSATYSFTVNTGRSLLANFSLRNFTITASSSPSAGGTTTGAGTYTYGTNATLTATPSAGYQFVNWTESGTVVSTNAGYTFVVTGNRSVVANFSLITFSVSTSSSPTEGGTTSGGGNFNPNTSATVTATPASGYLFVNWTEGGAAVSTNSSYTFLVTANRSLVASFQSISYLTINTLSSPSLGGTTSGSGTFTSGSRITVSATASAGYNFVNWTEGGTPVSSSESYTFTVSASRTLVANFNQFNYTVSTSSSPSAGGTTGGGGTYNYGDEATVSSTPATGYQFVNWTVGGSAVSTSPSYTFTVTGNRSLVANFSQTSYSITTSSSPSAGGTTSGGGTFTYGASVTVNATPSGGYSFINWTQGGSSVSTSGSYTFTVTESRTIVANFSQITYTITTASSPTAGGSTSGGGTYGSGLSATVTATPATGYQFVNWTQGGSAVSTSASYTFTVNAARALVANFTQAAFTVATASSPPAGGSTSGGGSFSHGASVTVSSSPAAGYQFTNWTEAGIVVSASGNYTFTVASSRSLLANFTQIPRVLNLTGPGGTALRNNDIITISNSEAGSLLITVDANAEWTATESSLWLKAVKESNTSLRVTYMENISVLDKQASLRVTTALNAEIQITIKQAARISQLKASKFEKIGIYPNPASDRTNISFGEEMKGKVNISVSGIKGNLLKTIQLTDIQTNQIVELELSGIRTGQYLITVSDVTGRKVFSLIKY